MATTDKESSAAGTDNRPPMLEESDFESWKIRYKRDRAKEIWENVELLMQGSGLTEQQKKETLFDQYERFWANGNESIHDYFYVTIVKNNKDISIMSYVDLYTHLKSYEQHALKTLSKMNQTLGNADPLAYMAKSTQSISLPSQYVPPPPSVCSCYNIYSSSLTNVADGNDEPDSTIQAGQITTKSVQQRAPGNKGKHTTTGSQEKVWLNVKALLMDAKRRRLFLDAEAKLFADVECTTSYVEPWPSYLLRACESIAMMAAYDSDSMKNLTHGCIHGHYDADWSIYLDRAPVSQEIHGEEQLDSDVDSVIDDHDTHLSNIHQYK
ncbi:hypothetical protein Tco_1474355 [Tanacetum coccineum]